MRIAVLVSGNGSNLQALLDADSVRPHVALVVSNKPGVRALQRAEEAGCPTAVITRSEFASREEFDEGIAGLLKEHDIDLVVLAGWMHILGPRYLSTAPRTINLHPALPGHYPGLNAIERAWNEKVEVSGCMVHEVIEEVDAGTVLGTADMALSRFSNLQEFTEAMHRAEHKLLVRVVSSLVSREMSIKGNTSV